MQKFNVVFLDTMPEEAHAIYRSCLPENVHYTYLESKDESEKKSKLQDADVFMFGGYRVDKATIDLAPKLKLIHIQGVGYEKIDVAYATKKGIPVCTTPAGTENVAEHTLMLILASLRRLTVIDAEMRQGIYPRWDYVSSTYALAGKTVGIVGFGRIGRAVAKLLLAFGTTVIFLDKFTSLPLAEQRTLNVEQVASMDELCERSDIITLHMPLTTDDTGIINKNTVFNKMKKPAFLINTSRGSLVNEKDLYEALKNGRIAGAGTDVFEVEPVSKDNPLLTLNNIVMTAHNAAVTYDAHISRAQFIFANITRLINGESLSSCVNVNELKAGLGAPTIF